MSNKKDLIIDPLEVETPKVSALAKDEVEVTNNEQLQAIQDKGKLAGFSGWFVEKNGVRSPSRDSRGEYVFTRGAKAICKVIPMLLLAIGLFCGVASAALVGTEIAVHTNFAQDAGWKVDASGDLVPITDSTNDIGESGFEVRRLYADAITLNAVGYTSLLGSSLTTNNVDAANSIWAISNGLVFEGATANTFEITISPVDPTADATWSIPNFAVASAFLGSTLTTNNVEAANSVWAISNSLVFEGATADDYEGTLAPADVTADRTWTLPNKTGTIHNSGTATALTAGAAVTLTVVPGKHVFTDTITTDNEDQTITFSAGGSAGDVATIVFITDTGGSADETITFQTTLTNSAGTLTLANLTAGRYVVSFVSDGTVWNEVSRTAALS